MKNLFQRSLSACIVLLFLTAGIAGAKESQEVDQKRNQLIGYMLDKQLPSIHFSDKKMDSSLSTAAFNLYLKQLDYQKRFLLARDVEQLRTFAPYIADSLEHGTIVLPQAGYEIIKERIAQVEKMVDQILAAGFDMNSDETLETDPEKLAYADDLNGLKDRWRKIVRAQVITKYLDLLEDQKNSQNAGPNTHAKNAGDTLWKDATDKVAKINKDFFLRLNQETPQDQYDRFFNSVARAFDPHTDYLPPDKKEDFDIQMRGSLDGIGALLREEGGLIKVVSIIPGSPSAKQGLLQAEDTILQVAEKGADPVEISDMRLTDAVRLIRGPKGTEVRLTVKKPDGTKVVIPIIRDVVQIEETFVKDTVLDSPDGGKIGYILIPSFYRDFDKSKNGDDARNVTDDTRKAIADLKKTKLEGVILDLRDNGGGSLVDAVDVAGLFVGAGPVVQVKNSYGSTRVLSDDEQNLSYGGPLVVLVNQFSASASEIVAAALQDYKRAVIVGGAHTHGKGTVQTIINLNDNMPVLQMKKMGDLGALKVTIQKFYRITGGSTQYKGVEPDIVLPSLFQNLKSGEKYLDYSLPWDQVGPVAFTPFSGRPINLEMIKRKSMQRVEHDEGLQVIAQEAKKSDERSKQTTISLKLADMRQKMEEAREERKKIGAQYRKYQKAMEAEDQNDSGKKPAKKDEPPNWQEDLKQDPYVGEAKNIILDMDR
ncbi:MAG: carboxy terminal-processing peptidase [Desulfocapsaceae bacterium]|nr:carboxy terminal-processing peptidase [Desulfocapsaceae bacterium]